MKKSELESMLRKIVAEEVKKILPAAMVKVLGEQFIRGVIHEARGGIVTPGPALKETRAPARTSSQQKKYQPGSIREKLMDGWSLEAEDPPVVQEIQQHRTQRQIAEERLNSVGGAFSEMIADADELPDDSLGAAVEGSEQTDDIIEMLMPRSRKLLETAGVQPDGTVRNDRAPMKGTDEMEMRRLEQKRKQLEVRV